MSSALCFLTFICAKSFSHSRVLWLKFFDLRTQHWHAAYQKILWNIVFRMNVFNFLFTNVKTVYFCNSFVQISKKHSLISDKDIMLEVTNNNPRKLDAVRAEGFVKPGETVKVKVNPLPGAYEIAAPLFVLVLINKEQINIPVEAEKWLRWLFIMFM